MPVAKNPAFWFLMVVLLFRSLEKVQPVFAQKLNPVQEQQWKKLTAEKAFGYKNEQEFTSSKNSFNEGLFSKSLRAIALFFASPSGRLIVWLGIFFLLAFAGFKIVTAQKSGLFYRKNLPAGSVPDESKAPEPEFKDIRFEDLFRQAAEAGNMRLAIRYSFMLLLQMMQQKKLIQYKADATNLDYYKSLQNPDLKGAFRQLSRQYEYVWYGNYSITEDSFQQYVKDFETFKALLNRS